MKKRFLSRVSRHAHTGGNICWRVKHAFVWTCLIRELLHDDLEAEAVMVSGLVEHVKSQS